ncbi:MAG: alpha-2-macroglobulin family protein, partial [Myxococcota bacterium]
MLALSAFGGLALSCARPIGSPVAAGDASGGAAPAAVGDANSKEQTSSPAPVPPPSSLAELAPVMRAVSNAGSLLDRIIIEFARDVVNKAGDAPPGTEIRVTPGVEGATLHYIRPHTLVLRLPEGAAFANHTRYEVTLEAITVGSGETIKAAAGEAPVYVFTTPPFGLERVTVTDFDARASTLTFDMAFTGPVDTQEVKESVSIQVAGDEAGLALIPQENPGVVRLRGTSRRFRAGESLLLQVGALSGGSPRREIPPSTHRIEVPQGPELQIYSAHMSETSSGFVIHIVCNDEGAGKESMYHWDPHVHEGWEVSSRCELHANALSKVHLSPDPGAISISPSRGGFDLQGDFKRGTYQLRIDAGAHSVDGGQLHGAFEGLLQVPARSSSVEFSVQGRYLPRDTWTKLPLRHLNVPRISLSLRHVPAENLVFWMSGDSESADARTSEFISSKTIDLEHAPDAVTTTWVDLSDLLPRDRKGVFELRAQGRSGRSDARRLVLTDMNLVAKRTESEVQVWTFGIHDNAPLPGAQVRLVTRSGQELSRCLTDAQGGCRLTHQRDAEAPTRERFAVIATRGDDVSYLKFADVEIPTDQADVSGASYRDDQSPYKAALYTDRGVYRPGETVHIVSVLREQNGGLPPSQLPVTLLVHDSRDKLVSKQALATQSAGLIAYDLALESFAATGKYKVVLKAAEIVIGSLEVQVEEFVPERMRVNVQAQQREAIVNELTSLTVDAQYLFGGSAAGSPVEVSCDLEPASFRAPDFAEYAFDVWRPQQAATKPLHLGKRTGTLDGEGALEVRCPSPEQGVGLAGASRLRARASVFEAGSGRTTVGEGGFLVHPARHYIGLKSSVDSVKVGESFRVEGVVVDWDGKPVEWNEPVKVSLHRVSYSYGWTYNETDGSWSNRRHQRVTKAAEAEVRAKGGKFTVELNAIEGASLHLVRAEAAGARTDLSMEGRGYFYAWDYGWDEDRGDDTPRPARPASLRLSVPEEIVVGQRSAVTLKVPFPGRLLMTVESDEILHHEWREVQSGETSIEFELKKFIPNVYVSALLLKDPHLESQEAFLPARAFAVTSVRVAPSAYVQPLAVNVPAEVRSNSTLQVELDVNPLAGDTFVTVAAVDEGILQLTKFKTPDPLAAIFERRRLEVHTFDTVGWNLNQPAAGNSRRHGGDEGAGVG